MKVGKRWRRSAQLACLTALAAATLWTASRAADNSDPAPKVTSELDLIPSDSEAVISLHLAELWNDEAVKAARKKLTEEAPDFFDGFVEQVGVAPDEIERATAAIQSIEPESPAGFVTRPRPPQGLPGVIQSIASGSHWLLFITTTKPYDLKKVLAATTPDAEERPKILIKGRAFYANPEGYSSIAVLSDRTYVLGPEEEVKGFLKDPAGAHEGPLTPALRATEKHCLAAGFKASVLLKRMGFVSNSFGKFLLGPFLKARSFVLTADLGKQLKAEGKIAFDDESDAKAGAERHKVLLEFGRHWLEGVIHNVGRQKDMEKVVALLEKFQAGVKAGKVQINGPAIEALAEAKIDLKTAASDLVETALKVRDTALKVHESIGPAVSANNLKQLALAMYDYHAVYSHFPTAAVYDQNGKPLLSWRVRILPYIEQEALYKQFHLDEPWDGEHNKRLLNKMPPLFAAGDEQAFRQALKKHETHYQTFVGKGAMFDGEKGVKFADVTDGLSNTLLIVEAKKAVPWTKPEDVPFDKGKLVSKLGGLFEGIFNAAFADGSVRALPLTIKEEKLRALITRDGGEVIQADK